MEKTITKGAWKGHLGRGLAPRELQFLLSVVQGLTAKEVAREHGVTPGTVVKRLSNAMYKLGVNRQTAMIAEAMRRQIISPMCFVLAALMTLNAMVAGGSGETGRRPPSSRTAQVRIARRIEASA
ncbi:response regulator transcription factor [Pseudomonas sp. NPDC098747]|uniref:response regulator transcription factor n=1 Tax=Pseudomonas sp. NPDC098747 TaxID=3364487 RepID=UPI00383ADC71